MVLLNIKNQYSLQKFFDINQFISDNHIIILPIYNYSLDNYVYINSSFIQFNFKIDEYSNYLFHFTYSQKNIYSISEYVRVFSPIEHYWREMYDYEDNVFINTHREYIRMMLKTCFHNIKTKFKSTDSDMMESPWFYKKMFAFEQRISLYTLTIVRQFINKIRFQLELKKYYHKTLRKNAFCNWKEWYFNPINQHGYLKKLRMCYSWKNAYQYNIDIMELV
jgi:hypothetical protein